MNLDTQHEKRYDIILCGAYGTGKTTVATLLAQVLKAQFVTEPVDHSSTGAELPVLILSGKLPVEEYAARIEEYYSSPEKKISRRPAQMVDVRESLLEHKETQGAGINGEARAKLLNASLKIFNEQWTQEIMSKITAGVKVTVWDCDAATLMVNAPYQALGDNYTDKICRIEQNIRMRRPDMHSHQYADVSMVLSDTRTLVDIICLADRDIAALRTGSVNQCTRYVLLTETSEETRARIEKRRRMGDTLIATNGVVGMQAARLSMFFGLAPPADDWIAARRDAIITLSRFANTDTQNGEQVLRIEQTQDDEEYTEEALGILDYSQF